MCLEPTCVAIETKVGQRVLETVARMYKYKVLSLTAFLFCFLLFSSNPWFPADFQCQLALLAYACKQQYS